MWRTSLQLENFPIKFNQYILHEPSTVINNSYYYGQKILADYFNLTGDGCHAPLGGYEELQLLQFKIGGFRDISQW